MHHACMIIWYYIIVLYAFGNWHGAREMCELTCMSFFFEIWGYLSFCHETSFISFLWSSSICRGVHKYKMCRSRYSQLYGRCWSSCIIVREYVPPSLLRRRAQAGGGHASFFNGKAAQNILNCEWISCRRMRSIRTGPSLGCLHVLGVSSRTVKFEHEAHAC